MLESKKKSIYQNAIKKWGVPMQLVMAIEECAELQKAITKELRYGETVSYGKEKALKEALCEEIADVEIMLEQLKIIFDNEHKVKKTKECKIKKLEGLIRGAR